MQKGYVVKKEDGTIETRLVKGFIPKGVICQAPKDENGKWVTDIDLINFETCKETGALKAKPDSKAIALKKHREDERRKKEQEARAAKKKAKKEIKYSGISQDELMKAKSFDDLKKYISYLLKINGVD